MLRLENHILFVLILYYSTIFDVYTNKNSNLFIGLENESSIKNFRDPLIEIFYVAEPLSASFFLQQF